jgi:hypothetical protein
VADVGTFIVAWAAAQPDLVALVGDRVAPWKEAQGLPLPRIAYYLVGGDTWDTLAGTSGVARQVYAIDCEAATEAEARAVLALVKGTRATATTVTGLNGYAGTAGGVTVQCCQFQSDHGGYEDPVDASDAGVFMAGGDFEVTWNQSEVS